MTLRYIIRTKDKKGHFDQKEQSFSSDAIVIGRGGRSDVIVQSRLLSLEHARISIVDDKLLVEDLGSFSGLRVDNLLTKKASASVGSVIGIGDISVRVERDDSGWALIEERVEQDTQGFDELIKQQARALSFQTHFPSMRVLCTFLALVVMASCFVWPYMRERFDFWSSGPISNPHSMVGASCQSCHAEPFARVQDRECLNCHKLSEHSEAMPFIIKDFRELDWRCQKCHQEHNGDFHFTTRDSMLCTECHVRLTDLYKESKKPNISNFKNHAQFSVGLKRELVAGSGRLSVLKVSLDDKKNLIDPTHIKLNHAVHLKGGIRGPNNSKVSLGCSDCHALAEDKKSIAPIQFEKSCQGCHPLTFDDRLGTTEVPHGDPDVVFNYLYAEYAKLLLADQGTKAAAVAVQRFKPGGSLAVNQATEVHFDREQVEHESRNSEGLLFTKTACLLCHDISEKGSGVDSQTGVMVSRFSVLNPEIPMRWMPASIFSHGAHQELRCDSCHQGARTSEKTSDVLLPTIEGCRDCHIDPGAGEEGVRSNCSMCHSYHEPLLLDDAMKRKVEEVLYRK